jgi:CBS-domain-containing membrane protein
LTKTVGDALKIMEEHKIGGIPVVDNNNKLQGIITNRDLRFEKKQGPWYIRNNDQRKPNNGQTWNRPSASRRNFKKITRLKNCSSAMITIF